MNEEAETVKGPKLLKRTGLRRGGIGISDPLSVKNGPREHGSLQILPASR